MIINIPLQVNEQKIEEVLQRDYEGKVLNMINDYIKKTLADNATVKYGDRVSVGMRVLVEAQIDKFLEAHRDEIIKNAAVVMAEKLARSKRGKELLEEVCK